MEEPRELDEPNSSLSNARDRSTSTENMSVSAAFVQMSRMQFDMSGSVNTAFHDVYGGKQTISKSGMQMFLWLRLDT